MNSIPLERKIPLLMTLVLAATLFSAMGLAYREVTQAAEQAAISRLQNATHQLAELSTTAIRRRSQLMALVAADPIVRATADAGHVRDIRVFDALRPLTPPLDSTSVVEIMRPDGTVIASTTGPMIDNEGNNPISYLGLRGTIFKSLSDSVHYSPFFTGPDKHVYYWVTTPISSNGWVMGFLVQQVKLVSKEGEASRINNLVGEHTIVYFQNDSGTLWTDLSGHPSRAPEHQSVFSGTRIAARAYSRPTGGVLATVEQIRSTPWKIILEIPQATVITPVHSILVQFIVLSVVLLIVAAMVMILITRQITHPLRTLTAAVKQIARGDYGIRVALQGSDEIGELSLSVNKMVEEVGRAHRDLEEARSLAVSANRAKSNFLATMSHEIRTPINAILGYTDILSLQISGPLTEAQKSNLDRIQVSTNHLLGLVNEVLDVAKIEAGSMNLPHLPSPIESDLNSAMALVTPQAHTKNLTLLLEYASPKAREAVYMGDSRSTRQALANILSNAIKFTPPKGRITVSCGLALDPANLAPGRYLRIDVRDTGIGITQSDIMKLFKPFTQIEGVDNPYTRRHGGAGLGLSITRSLAQLMCGDVTVESQFGTGSTFTLWLFSASQEPL